jgi:hypothetical protein
VCTGRKKEEEGGRGCVIERMCAWILFSCLFLFAAPSRTKAGKTREDTTESSVSCPCFFLLCVESVVALLNFLNVWRAKVCFDTMGRSSGRASLSSAPFELLTLFFSHRLSLSLSLSFLVFSSVGLMLVAIFSLFSLCPKFSRFRFRKKGKEKGRKVRRGRERNGM